MQDNPARGWKSEKESRDSGLLSGFLKIQLEEDEG